MGSEFVGRGRLGVGSESVGRGQGDDGGGGFVDAGWNFMAAQPKKPRTSGLPSRGFRSLEVQDGSGWVSESREGMARLRVSSEGARGRRTAVGGVLGKDSERLRADVIGRLRHGSGYDNGVGRDFYESP